MKILNLYAGIGGNRKLWGDEHEITAVENDKERASFYKEQFPNDEMVIGDAHEYLLNNFDKYDFIWSSPPCPSHSDIRRCGVKKGQYPAIYPEMSLYQEVILLQNFANKDTKWVIENVKPYYKPLIPAREVQRHLFWSNFWINELPEEKSRKHNEIVGSSVVYGFDISKTKISDKRKTLRNMVDPNLGLHIFKEAFREHLTLF